MSTYLTIVASTRWEAALERWLVRHRPEAGDEHLVQDLPVDGYRLHHLGRAASADRVASPAPGRGDLPAEPLWGALFRGYAQDPEGTTMVFGATGVRQLLQRRPDRPGRPGREAPWRSGTVPGPLVDDPGTAWDGVHLAVTWDRDRVAVHTDLFRILPLLYTEAPGLVAFSDSWQLLVRLRTALGLSVSIHAETVCAMATPGGITEHPLSEATACSQVRLASVGSRVVVPWRRDASQGASREHALGAAVLDQRPFPEVFAPPLDDWVHTVRRGAAHLAGTLATIAQLPGASLTVELSGGLDSRAVLAGARRADPGQQALWPEAANFGPVNQRDYDIAQAMMAAVGLDPADPTGQASRHREDYGAPFSVWMLGSLGLHDRIKVRPYRVTPSATFSVGGFGGEALKGNYGWRPFTLLADQLEAKHPGSGGAAGRQGIRYLRSVGVDPQAPDTSEWHYTGLRNSLHGGRETLSNLLCFPPLNQRALVGLAHAPGGSRCAIPPHLRDDPGRTGPSATDNPVAAMLCLLDPTLARQPFDQPKKTITAERLEQVLAAAGGPIQDEEIRTATVYGSAEEVVSGAAKTFLSLTSSWGQDLPLEHEELAPLVREGARIAREAGFGEWYDPALEVAEGKLAERGRFSHQSGRYGRLMTFLPLADATVDGSVDGSVDGAADGCSDGVVSPLPPRIVRAVRWRLKRLSRALRR